MLILFEIMYIYLRFRSEKVVLETPAVFALHKLQCKLSM